MKKLTLLISMMVLLSMSHLAYGQCSSRVRVITPVTPVIVTPVAVPIAVPVLVPAFQFQYSPPCYAPPVVQSPAYQQTQPGYPGYPPPTMPQGGNMYGGGAPQGSQDKIKELAKALIDEMRRQSDQEQNGDGPPMATGFNGGGSVPPQPNNLAARQQAEPLAIAALSRACTQCHTGVGSKHDVMIFTQPGVLNPNAPFGMMRRAIDAGRMPPQSHGYRLTLTEIEALRIWLPQN